MIIEKKFDKVIYSTMKELFPTSSFIASVDEKLTITTDDTDLINWVGSNFDDFVETELRLDALEALIVGEQSLLTKIRSKVGL